MIENLFKDVENIIIYPRSIIQCVGPLNVLKWNCFVVSK